MYHDTYYDYKQSVMTDYLEKEMRKHKDTAIEIISRVAHSQKECVLKILAYSFFEEHEDAIKLAESLDLSKLEFLAVLEDFDGFKEIFLKEQDKYQEQEFAQNF